MRGMKASIYTEEQLVGILREADRDSVSTVAKRHGVTRSALGYGSAKSVRRYCSGWQRCRHRISVTAIGASASSRAAMATS